MANDDNTKVMSILAYIFFFVPLIAGAHKKSEVVKFHTNQGTVLFIAAVIYAAAYTLLTWLLAFIALHIGFWFLTIVGLITLLLGLFHLAFLALAIIGIVNAATDKQNPLPVIGKFTIIK